MKKIIFLFITFISLLQAPYFATIMDCTLVENNEGRKVLLVGTRHVNVVAHKNGYKISYQNFYDNVFFTELNKIGILAAQNNKSIDCIYEFSQQNKGAVLQNLKNLKNINHSDTTLDELAYHELNRNNEHEILKTKFQISSAVKIFGGDPRKEDLINLTTDFFNYKIKELPDDLNKEKGNKIVTKNNNHITKMINEYKYHPTIGQINELCTQNYNFIVNLAQKIKTISLPGAQALMKIAGEMVISKDMFLEFLLTHCIKLIPPSHQKMGDIPFFNVYAHVFKDLVEKATFQDKREDYNEFKELIFSFCEKNDIAFSNACFFALCLEALNKNNNVCIVCGDGHLEHIKQLFTNIGFVTKQENSGSCYRYKDTEEEVLVNGVGFAQVLKNAVAQLAP